MTLGFWPFMLAVAVVAFAPLFMPPAHRPKRRRDPFGRVNLWATAWPAATFIAAAVCGFLIGFAA